MIRNSTTCKYCHSAFNSKNHKVCNANRVAANRQRREMFRAAGLCWRCRARLDSDAHRACVRRLTAAEKRRKVLRKALGSCYLCSSPTEGDARCSDCITAARARSKKFHAKNKSRVFDHYGRRCACCGEERSILFLAIDHMDGGGAKHKKSIKSKSLYKWLIDNNFPDRFQTLCHNCNIARYLNGGTCPHQTAATR